MEQDNYTTDMVFRCDKHGDFKDVVFALFPHEVNNRNGNVTCYMHVGQHSTADYKGCIASSRPATEEEYKDLKAELEGRGYKVNVVKKQNPQKYLESYNEVRKNLG